MVDSEPTKTCSVCRIPKDFKEFPKRVRGKYGLDAWCILCWRNYRNKYVEENPIKVRKYLLKYRATEAGKEMMKRAAKKQRNNNPDKCRARDRIKYLIRKKRIEYPQTLSCNGCGKSANEYHHYKGYEKENWLDVIPLCYSCHGKIHHPSKGKLLLG